MKSGQLHAVTSVSRLPQETVFVLPLSKDYVRHWGMPEAVRELIQNALDSESPFEWELDADCLRVISRHSRLDVRSLLLGSTSKADRTDAIGSFGEGYKIALLVLARAGYTVRVYNDGVVWVPEFRYSRKFESEVFCVVQSTSAERREGLEFAVHGLGEGDVDRIKASCLQMQGHIGEVSEVEYGRILHERPGKLYVGGLYVCETQLKFGYDVKPQHLRLERDRQTVSTFDLKWLTKEMWFAAERVQQVAQLIEADAPDLEYAHHGAPQLVKEACYRLFLEKHPGAVAARNQAELDDKVKSGMTHVVVVSEPMYGVLHSTREYTDRHVVRVAPPAEQLKLWFEKNRSYMRTPAIVSFKELLRKADRWRTT